MLAWLGNVGGLQQGLSIIGFLVVGAFNLYHSSFVYVKNLFKVYKKDYKMNAQNHLLEQLSSSGLNQTNLDSESTENL